MHQGGFKKANVIAAIYIQFMSTKVLPHSAVPPLSKDTPDLGSTSPDNAFPPIFHFIIFISIFKQVLQTFILHSFTTLTLFTFNKLFRKQTFSKNKNKK